MIKMYEEIMTNDDNLESNLLTSSLLKKMCSLYKLNWRFQVSARLERYWFLYEQRQVNHSVGIDSIGYQSLPRSVMDSL